MKPVHLFFFSFLLPALALAQNQPDPKLPKLGKNSIKEVVAAMTLDEKTKLVVGMGFRMQGGPRRDSAAARRDSSRTNPPPAMPAADPETVQLPEKVPGAAGRTRAIPRLGIPSITVSDGPAGVRISPFRHGDSTRSYYATAFPVATLLASTWDTALVLQVGQAFGSEVHEYGVDILLGPGLNIHRNPLGGRNFEYYSEDPVLAGNMTAAIVNGMQSNGVGTSIKHFAVNNQETNRNSINTIVSERALREIYLKGFEIAVKKSNPWTVMSSYNKLNGTYTSELPALLINVLRNEWGFKGMVMSDWFGGKDPVAQMKAGNDLLMPGTPNQSKAILDAVNSGKLDLKQLDENVERILKTILLSPEFRNYKYSDRPDLAKDAQVARKAASEGMVLLKNDAAVLPWKQAKKIAVFGNTSYDIIAGGTGSGDVNKAYIVSLTDGLTKAGYSIDENLKNEYSKHIADAKSKRPRQRNMFALPPPIPEMNIPSDQLSQLASDADLAVITIGRNAGEGADRKLEDDYYLSAAEKELIRNVAEAFHARHKKLVVILNVGGVVEVADWKDQADGILLAWQPGLEAGNAITDILSGKVNPSGKLATTFPVNYKDVPSAKNFPGKELPSTDTARSNRPGFGGKPSEVIYEEGIYIGYRYYSTFHIKPAYEFGYGLSYTHFTYGPLKLSSSSFKNSLTATVTITNSGQVAGKEVVQCYISAPAEKMDKPSEELKGFAKTALLQPGKSQTLVFTIRPEDLASYDTQRSSWIADAGTYTVNIAASAINIKQKASFQLPKEIVAKKLSRQLSPEVDIHELKKEGTAFIYELNNFAVRSR